MGEYDGETSKFGFVGTRCVLNSQMLACSRSTFRVTHSANGEVLVLIKSRLLRGPISPKPLQFVPRIWESVFSYCILLGSTHSSSLTFILVSVPADPTILRAASITRHFLSPLFFVSCDRSSTLLTFINWTKTSNIFETTYTRNRRVRNANKIAWRPTAS